MVPPVKINNTALDSGGGLGTYEGVTLNNVTFTGLLTKHQVRDLIHPSDAAILLSAHEGSPISVKEVLACGKPVIVNDVGDLTD